MSGAESTPWWRTAVIYEIYPRSFADADGDGEGDLRGITSRLGYLRDLGIDALWIAPWYPSPMADGGYDVSDYTDIHPTFGTLDDARELLEQAHAHGIRKLPDANQGRLCADGCGRSGTGGGSGPQRRPERGPAIAELLAEP